MHREKTHSGLLSACIGLSAMSPGPESPTAFVSSTEERGGISEAALFGCKKKKIVVK